MHNLLNIPVNCFESTKSSPFTSANAKLHEVTVLGEEGLGLCNTPSELSQFLNLDDRFPTPPVINCRPVDH